MDSQVNDGLLTNVTSTWERLGSALQDSQACLEMSQQFHTSLEEVCVVCVCMLCVYVVLCVCVSLCAWVCMGVHGCAWVGSYMCVLHCGVQIVQSKCDQY